MTPFIFFLADVALRSTLILGVVFLVLSLMRRSSASERHLVLLLGLFVVALTPAGVLLSPKILWTYDVPASIEPSTPMPATVVSENEASPGAVMINSSAETLQPERAKWDYSDGLGILLAAGMAAQVFLFLRAALAWQKIRLDAVRANLPDAALTRARTFAGARGVPPIFASDRIAIPLLAGWRRPEIILPSEANEWPVGRLAMVLCHEIAHFLRGDTLLLPFSALMRVLYWWHPLVWLALARLRRERENACDDLVLAQNFRATDYADLIVETARQARTNSAWPATALAMASSNNISERIRAILDPALRRKSASRRAILIGIALALALGWPLVATEIQAQEKTETVTPAVPSSSPPSSAASYQLVKIAVRFMEIDEKTYKNDPDTIDTLVEKGDVSAALKLPGVSLFDTPQVMTREEEQAVIENLLVVPVQDPATHAYTKRNVGYRVVVKPTLNADGAVSVNATPEITEYQGMIQNQGVDQPLFDTRRVNLQFVSKDGETKGFWLGNGYHLTELMANLEKTPTSFDAKGLLPLVSKGPAKRLAVFFTVSLYAEDGKSVHAQSEEKVNSTENQLNKSAQLPAHDVPTVDAIAYSFYMVEVDEKAYEQDRDAMDEAVAKGDIHFFDNKKSLSVKPDQVVVPVGKAAWCSEGQQCQYVESVARETKDGKSHTAINLANMWAGVHVDCRSSMTSFPESSLGPPEGPIRLNSAVQVTEFIGADTLPLSQDIPPGDITTADEMPISPRYHVFTFNYNDWEPAAGKMHGRWVDGVLDYELLVHPHGPQSFASGRTYPKTPCRLAVFLGAEMVKVPAKTPKPGP